MGVKLCLEPACWNVTAGSRCADHEREYQRVRNASKARKPRRTAGYLRTVIVGVCLCCGTGEDLTRHHRVPLASRRGMWPADEDLVPMCRACNSSIGTRRMADDRCPKHGGQIIDSS